MSQPLQRRSRIRQAASVLVWSLGLGVACLGAVLAVALVSGSLGLYDATDLVDAGSHGVTWVGLAMLAPALLFAAAVLSVWTRVALGSRP